MIELKPGVLRAIDPAAIRVLYVDPSPISIGDRKAWMLYAEIQIGESRTEHAADYDSYEAAKEAYGVVLKAVKRAQDPGMSLADGTRRDERSPVSCDVSDEDCTWPRCQCRRIA